MIFPFGTPKQAGATITLLVRPAIQLRSRKARFRFWNTSGERSIFWKIQRDTASSWRSTLPQVWTTQLHVPTPVQLKSMLPEALLDHSASETLTT